MHADVSSLCQCCRREEGSCGQQAGEGGGGGGDKRKIEVRREVGKVVKREEGDGRGKRGVGRRMGRGRVKMGDGKRSSQCKIVLYLYRCCPAWI